jgi:hypothetical protein
MALAIQSPFVFDRCFCWLLTFSMTAFNRNSFLNAVDRNAAPVDRSTTSAVITKVSNILQSADLRTTKLDNPIRSRAIPAKKGWTLKSPSSVCMCIALVTGMPVSY